MQGKKIKMKCQTCTGTIDSLNEAGAHDAEMEDLPTKSPIIVKPEPLTSGLESHKDMSQGPHGDPVHPHFISDDAKELVTDNTTLGIMNNDGPSGPVVNIVQPTPQTSPVKPPVRPNGFLHVPHPDIRASSETPQSKNY